MTGTYVGTSQVDNYFNGERVARNLFTIVQQSHQPISPQYKNANIAYFILAMALKINKVNGVCNLEM